MALWYCLRCTAGYAVGLAACPQCGATEHEQEHEHMAKITSAGPSYEPGKDPNEPDQPPASEADAVPEPESTEPGASADTTGQASPGPAEPQDTAGEGDRHELPPAPPPHEQ